MLYNKQSDQLETEQSVRHQVSCYIINRVISWKQKCQSRKLYICIFLPWQKEVMFLVALVCLFVCLFVSNITQKGYERIAMKFMGRSGMVQGRTG